MKWTLKNIGYMFLGYSFLAIILFPAIMFVLGLSFKLMFRAIELGYGS